MTVIWLLVSVLDQRIGMHKAEQRDVDSFFAVRLPGNLSANKRERQTVILSTCMKGLSMLRAAARATAYAITGLPFLGDLPSSAACNDHRLPSSPCTGLWKLAYDD